MGFMIVCVVYRCGGIHWVPLDGESGAAAFPPVISASQAHCILGLHVLLTWCSATVSLKALRSPCFDSLRAGSGWTSATAEVPQPAASVRALVAVELVAIE